jgi:hypothetical protein
MQGWTAEVPNRKFTSVAEAELAKKPAKYSDWVARIS